MSLVGEKVGKLGFFSRGNGSGVVISKSVEFCAVLMVSLILE